MARRQRFTWAPDLLCECVDQVMTVLDPQTATLYELNEVGAMVWQECRAPSDVETVTGQLKKAFPKQSSQSLRREADAFIVQLTDAGLLRRVAA